MDRGPLKLVKGDRGQVMEEFYQLVQGHDKVNPVVVEKTVTAIDNLLESDGFNHLAVKLASPVQQLVEIALRIKELEKRKIMGVIEDGDSLLGVNRNSQSSEIFNLQYAEVLRERWGHGLEEASVEQMTLMREDLDQQLSEVIKIMSESLFPLAEQELIVSQADDRGKPLIYMVLLGLFGRLPALMSELIGHLNKIEFALQVLYSPLEVDHLLNDDVLVRMGRIVDYLKILVGVSKQKRWDSMPVLENVLDSAEIFPVYHDVLAEWDWAYLKLNNVSSVRCVEVINAKKVPLLMAFVSGEKEKLESEMRKIGDENGFKSFVITPDKDDLFSQSKLIKRKVEAEGIDFGGINKERPAERAIVAEDLSDAIAKVCDNLGRTGAMREEMLNMIYALVVEGKVDEAEFLHRVYLLLTNFVIATKHNQKDVFFAVWQKNKSEQAEMVAAKKRIEFGIRSVVGLPTAASAATETASTKSSAAETTRPTGR